MDCGKQISEEKKDMIDKRLLEKISLRGIGRSLGIGRVM